MNQEDNGERNYKKPKINREDGLNIDYDRKELKKYLPHLMDEIAEQKKSLKINSVDYNVESIENKSSHAQPKVNNSHIEELTNPSVIDFIRRCSTNLEAEEILQYLLNKNEISQEQYNSIKKKISQENGLKNLIELHGGFKRPGYYLRKYYLKTKTSELEKND